VGAQLAVTLSNRLEEIERLATVVETCGEAHHLPAAVVYAINLSLDEVVTNVISYAFTDVQDHAIEVRLRLDAGEIQVDVVDDGRPFDPRDVPAPDLDAPLEERGIGGLGLHIVRKMMDGLSYRREGSRNVLTLRKRLG
jgi:anti-sigma regulatory factor (Ser/Thr protein kinase)